MFMPRDGVLRSGILGMGAYSYVAYDKIALFYIELSESSSKYCFS